jgi:hypothetical protein
MIITDTKRLEYLGTDVQLLLEAYEELLEYAVIAEKNLIAARIRWLYETETLPHKHSWINARKELLPKARGQLTREMGYRGLSERSSK